MATGAVIIDAKYNVVLGIPFIAFLPFIGIAAGVYLFGKISMAHFNPAVTLGFLITKHITKLQLVYYFSAEILGALLGSLFVMYIIGNEADLGTNSPNYAFPLPTIFGIEVLASALLMAVIAVVVYTRGLRGYGGLGIGGIVRLSITVDSQRLVAQITPAPEKFGGSGDDSSNSSPDGDGGDGDGNNDDNDGSSTDSNDDDNDSSSNDDSSEDSSDSSDAEDSDGDEQSSTEAQDADLRIGHHKLVESVTNEEQEGDRL